MEDWTEVNNYEIFRNSSPKYSVYKRRLVPFSHTAL